jgi:predicted acetyltransferase
MTDGVRVRPALEADLERLAEIHACAYPDSGGIDYHARCLTNNAFGGLERVRVAEWGGSIVGHATLYLLETWLGGGRVPTSGIGSLAVAPEVRRRGVARAMLDALHAEAASDGSALALLYPFRQSFYVRDGYAPVSPRVTLRVAIEALDSGPSPRLFTPVRVEGPRLHEARALYESVAERASGRVVRSELRWMKLFAREHRHWLGVLSPSGRLEGYVSFAYGSGPTSAEHSLVVHELTARDAASTRALLGACADQRDQIAHVVLTVPYGDPLALAFRDAAGSRPESDDQLGTLSNGPMVRIVDLVRALATRGYAADGELTIACAGESSRQPVRLSVRENTAQAAPVNVEPDFELTSSTLASMIAAGLRPVEAAELGLLRATPSALRLAERMFAGPRFQCLDPF